MKALWWCLSLVGTVALLLCALPYLFIPAVAGGAAAHGKATAAMGAVGAPSSVPGIPAGMLSAYTRAAASIGTVRPRCTGMRWSVLAGIGKVESNHASGRSIAPNGDITPRILGVRLNGSGAGGNITSFSDTDGGRLDGDTAYDRAVGPMQFLPSTWEGPSGQDGNGDGAKDPHNAYDTALGAAAYLCGTGAADLSNPAELRRAVFRYNRSTAYVDKVTGHVTAYDQTGPVAGVPVGAPAGGLAGDVIAVARKQIGLPYVWGGGNTAGPTGGGFDCSGLLVYAFHKAAGITLPRTSQTMRGSGNPVDRTAAQPGDIIVINNDGNWGHVGLYIGNGTMIHAPRPGKRVETTPLAGYWSKFDWDVRRVL
ncbi:NlpC/P60 family protein [Streptomyces sp. NPDC059698]